MNLGLGNLTDLKRALLPAALLADTDYDTVLEEIGLGVAKAFEDVCNRQFERLEDDTCEFSADRSYYALPRFPIESITSIEQRDTLADGWTALTINDVLLNRKDRSGLLEFGFTLGDFRSLIRVTYTAGYWFDTSEDYDTEQPSGSAPVPANLKHAWLLQCRHVLERTDAMGARSASDGKEEAAPQEIKLLPAVMTILTPFIRYA